MSNETNKIVVIRQYKSLLSRKALMKKEELKAVVESLFYSLSSSISFAKG